MAREWYAKCKDCTNEFGYSDASYRLSSRRGLSRPERCPNCRRLHSREIATLGLSHFELTPLRPIPATGLEPGRLGGLIRPERVHQERSIEPFFDYDKFGIKDEHILEYFEMMQRHQVTVIVAPTGAGKSTFVPFRLMAPPEPLPPDLWTRHGQIVITQPRIQATRNIPAFVAEGLHGSSLGAGFDVGFRHSGSPATDWRNKMVYMTDGTMINMIVRNELGRLSVIMIDEAHERSLNIDLILGLLKAQLPRYPHLKLIIASATIDTDLFINYYGGPDKVGFYEFPGKRQYPVEPRFWNGETVPEAQMARRMPDTVATKVFEILLAMETGGDPDLITMMVNGQPQRVRGDILAFLHGLRPIENAVAKIREQVDDEPRLAGKVDVLPLYTKLSQGQQDRALKSKPHKNRWRVVVSTNVAETSLTVEGIVHVVDSALINESRWDPQTQTSYVVPTIHSQAGCTQRWGRAGRVQPGIAHCLYTEEQFERFRAHTPPEILRSPLDQIVLTAKAAGVDDVQTFDWIQPPSQEELMRAPHYLHQIGALDADGDLTDHGLELRFFAAETDVANLMILADRFGCAVEMATLIPMLNQGGYTKLLQWDRGWDAATKRSVNRIYQGLIGPCLDDVEFYLKLWEAWDGSLLDLNESRERWASRHFVNHGILKETISQEREALLSSLSGHKKDDKARPIDFDLLTRVRMVLTYGLPNQIYQLKNCPEAGDMAVDDAEYSPYIPDPEANPALTELHKDAVVEISPESICRNRRLPEMFVCGKRQRLRRRISPQQEPITVITAAFLVLIKPEWLQVIGKPAIAVARMIATEMRSPDGNLIPTTTIGRLFIDQTYPIGATYVCQMQEDDQLVRLGEQQAPPPLLRPRSSFEEIEAADEVDVVEAERELDALAGVSEAGRKAATAPAEEDEELALWLDGLDNEDEDSPPSPHEPARFIQGGDFNGRIHNEWQSVQGERPFLAVVSGYDFTNPYAPIVELDIPSKPDPFETFIGNYAPGADITVAVTSVERYVNDWLMYLIVHEVETGLEIVLDPYDASLIGRNFAIDYFSQFEPGVRFSATVEEVDKKARHVRVTRLKTVEEAMLRFMGREAQRTVEALIVEVNEYGLYLWLDPEHTQEHLPIAAFAHVNQLPQRPEEMVQGQGCRVLVRQRQFKKNLRRSLPDLPEELAVMLSKARLGNNIEWDSQNQTLSVSGRLNYDQRRRLLSLSKSGSYQRAINILFRRSNELDAKVIDMTGMRSLAPYQGRDEGVKAQVTSVHFDALYAETEAGTQVRVPKQKAVFNRSVDLKEKYKRGDDVEILVKSVSMDLGEAEVSMLRPEDDPLRKYQANQRILGKVVGFTNDGSGAFIQLEPGVDGYLYKDEISMDQVSDARQALQEGDDIEARITKINYDKRRLRLTIRGLFIVQFTLEREQVGRLIGKGGSSINGIQEETGAQIDIDGETGRVTIVAANDTILRRTLDLVRETVTYCESTVRINPGKIGAVIGSGGSTIKSIQAQSGARVDISRDNSGLGRISADNRKRVDHAIRMVGSYAGSVSRISTTEAILPPVIEVRSSTPSRQKETQSAQPTQRTPQELKTGPLRQPTEVKSAVPAPTFEQVVHLSSSQLDHLVRKRGCLLAGFFGGGKSHLEKIQQGTSAQIEVNTSAGYIRVIGTKNEVLIQAAKDIVQAVK